MKINMPLSSSFNTTTTEPVSPQKDDDDNNDNNDDDEVKSMNSADEALFEMLGLPRNTGFEEVVDDDDNDDLIMVCNNSEEDDDDGKIKRNDADNHDPSSISILDDLMHSIQQQDNVTIYNELRQQYESDSVCQLPSRFNVPSNFIRRITNELIHGGPSVRADKTYETITKVKRKSNKKANDDCDNNNNFEIHEQRVLTRLENFVSYHVEWKMLCCSYIQKLVSNILGLPMVLYKEKLNLKPPGGSGFAPHLDTPSLRVAFAAAQEDDENVEAAAAGCGGVAATTAPQNFVTVMIAIDDMTTSNGCLRVVKGPWTENNHVDIVIPPSSRSEYDNNTDDYLDNTNPDGGGRAGAIPVDVSDNLIYEDILCKSGSITIFNGWVPHRSASNKSHFPRRAVFLTYNPIEDGGGDYHDMYYRRMTQLRENYKRQQQQQQQRQRNNNNNNRDENDDVRNELDALSTIPRI